MTPVHGFAIGFLTLATLFSIGSMARRRMPVAAFLAAVLAVYPVLYCLLETDPRSRTPILWISLLSTGRLVWSLLPAVQRRPVTHWVGHVSAGFPQVPLLK